MPFTASFFYVFKTCSSMLLWNDRAPHDPRPSPLVPLARSARQSKSGNAPHISPSPPSHHRPIHPSLTTAFANSSCSTRQKNARRFFNTGPPAYPSRFRSFPERSTDVRPPALPYTRPLPPSTIPNLAPTLEAFPEYPQDS